MSGRKATGDDAAEPAQPTGYFASNGDLPILPHVNNNPDTRDIVCVTTSKKAKNKSPTTTTKKKKKKKKSAAFRIHPGITKGTAPPPVKLFVKNISPDSSVSTLRSVFSRLGTVSRLSMPWQGQGRVQIAYVTIDCATPQAKKAAIEKVHVLNGTVVDRSAIAIEQDRTGKEGRNAPVVLLTLSELISSDTTTSATSSPWQSESDLISAVCHSKPTLGASKNIEFADCLIEEDEESKRAQWIVPEDDYADIDSAFEIRKGNDNLTVDWAGIRDATTKEILCMWKRGRFGWTDLVSEALSGKVGKYPLAALNQRIAILDPSPGNGTTNKTAKTALLPKRSWRCKGAAVEVFLPTEEDLRNGHLCNDLLIIKRGRFHDKYMRSDDEWKKYQALALMRKELYQIMMRRRAEQIRRTIEESEGGLNQYVPGYNLYEFARRHLNFEGSLEDFLTDPKHGRFAQKSKLLVCILQYHKANEAAGFEVVQESEGTITDEELKTRAEAEIKKRIAKGFDVFYISIGGEHKMRSDTPARTGSYLEIACSVAKQKYLKRSDQPDSFISSPNEVHSKVFPKEKRFCLMRAANRDNAERYEPILIETAFQYQKEGKLTLLNRLQGEKATRANLSRSQCGCYIYTEVWGSFTTKEKLAADNYEIA